MNRRIRAPDRALRRFLPSQRRRRVAKADYERVQEVCLRSPRCLFGMLVLVAALASPATAQVAACSGSNVLQELQRTDASAHARVEFAAAATENSNAILWRIEKAGVGPHTCSARCISPTSGYTRCHPR